MKREKKVLIATSEAVPFCKTGGLADMVGSLPKALEKFSADVSVVMPLYKSIDEKKFKMKKAGESFTVPMAGEMVDVAVKTAKLPDVKAKFYFIECEKYFGRDELYGDYHDNDERFALFTRSVLEMIRVLDLSVDLIHCNDWQTGLIPAYLKVLYGNDEKYKNISTVMTIHNIAYQGNFPAHSMEKIGLPWDIFNPDGVEFWGNVSYLKAGLVYADVLNTVSPTYAEEIQSSNEYGRGLEGLLASRHNDLFGILNGIDYDVWNPAKDDMIKSTFDESDLRGKSRCKKALQKDMNLGAENVPMVGIVSRLTDQKGFDLVAPVMDQIMNMDVQLVILGTGEQHYHDMLSGMAERYQGKLAVSLTFDEALAHQFYSSCDIFLIPSRFEPCGTSQMVCFKYGTLPVVHKTGGLADTVVDYMKDPDQGNGFVFEEYTSESLMDGLQRALELYANKRKWNTIVKRCMMLDFSWKNSAYKYMEMYEKAMEKHTAAV